MAYAAVISLKLTIHRLLNSSHTSVLSPSREILDVAYEQLASLQEALKQSDDSDITSRNKRFNALDSQIRQSAHQLQDSLESHASNQHADVISSPLLPLALDLQEVWPEITSFAQAAKKMEQDYIQILENPNSSEREEDDDGQSLASIPSRCIDSGVKMIGLSDSIADFKEHVLKIIRPDEFGVFPIFGGAGNGRSIVARRIYDDVYVNKEHSFDCGAWVRIGSTYQIKEILLTIIAQINQGDQELLVLEGEEKLLEYLYESLKGRRYVVVLDDVHDTEILSRLRRSLPEQDNGSMVLITTGLIEVARFEERFFVYEIPVIWDELLSWSYMQRVMFVCGGWFIPPEFEEAGKKIAKNCRGFRVMFVKVMVALMRSEKRLKFWKKLAEEEDDPIFMVDDEILEANQLQISLREGERVWANDLLDFSILIDRIKKNLFPERFFPNMEIMTVYGMAGVGKTTLVRNTFEDSSILHRYDHRAWVNIGPKYQSQDILVDILAQIYPDQNKRHMKKDAKLVEDLCAQLSSKKCLIVLDDVWSQEPVHFLKKLILNIKGELVFTTRLRKLGFPGPCDRAYKLRFLNSDESWDLLHEKVFGGECCPLQLENAGRKIAESCDGLPLVILAVAKKLSESEKTLEHWTEVAKNNIPIVMEAQYEISKGLLPIYESLPQHLKACFLYMGVFPQNYEIPTSTLIKLWFADGFLEPNSSQTVEEFATECLMELVERTVVMVKKGSDLNTKKCCSLHSVYWHLSCIAAMENNFFHALDTCFDISMENIERERRLCIRRGILLGIKDVFNAMESVTTSRALLCTGPPHQYPVPLCFGSRLLKVLEALAIRLYEFPVEVVKQLHLRYLALTCDVQLPPSISKLWNLQFLIVRQYLSIKNSENSSCLPNEIWDMKELKHLQVSGSKLPEPGALLPNLSSLLDVSVESCTKRVFKRLPNVKKLGIQIELEPNHDTSNPFRCLNRVSRLRKLGSLKCVVVNPDFGLAPPAPRSMFPSSLKKLCLSGLGYPWEHMHIIGNLPNLEVLKLRCYAFQGPFWKIDLSEFPTLKFLSIEDTDLVHWEFETPSIYHLKHLSFKHCYNLAQFPFSLPPLLEMFEVIDSHPLALSWAEKMKEDNWERRRMKSLEVHLQSSWTDDN